MMLQTQKIVVIGSGIVGLISAIAMHKIGYEVVLLEQNSLLTTPEKPCRLLSIALGSCKIISQLTSVDVAALGQPIRRIAIMQYPCQPLLEFAPEEIGEESFGFMVDEMDLMQALQEEAARCGFVMKRSKAKDVLHSVAYDTLVTENGESHNGGLLIVADGKNSTIRQKLGIEAVVKDYQHTALVCEIEHQKSHNGVAIENFTPQGSFGILPQTNSNVSSIVWSLSTPLSHAVMQLSPELQLGALADRIPEFLGSVRLQSDIKSYPLTLVYASEYMKHRCVLLGDALHSIHPLAGQGLNLSVRDVEYVCNSALNAKRLGLDVGANDFLHQYQKQRYTDNQLMVESTNLLHHLFANNSVFLSEIRANGAKCLDKIPMLKKMTMSYAAGTMVI